MSVNQEYFTVQYDNDGNVIFESVQKQHPLLAHEIQLIRGHLQQFTQQQEPQSSKPSFMSRLFYEGKTQYRDGLHEIEGVAESGYRGFVSLWRRIWQFLHQPVWVMRRKKEPRRYNRMTLFFYDTFQFGATFAVLFAGLFGVLNFESLQTIIGSQINPLQQKHEQLQASLMGTTIAQAADMSKLRRTSGSQSDLLSYLPPVGPLGNRIVLPTLGLNVPIADVELDSLLDENWEQLEDDIQDALQDGVVHYPGTARPGQAGNFFITGHSSYYPWKPGKFKTVFARLHELNVGDEYFVYYNGDQFRYRITDKREVEPTNVSVLDQPTNKRVSTLMTCTPLGTTLRRLIVSAVEIDPSTGAEMQVGERRQVAYPEFEVQTTVLPI